MSQTITFSKNSAKDETSAMDVLFNLFPDHYPHLVAEHESNWEFTLLWPIQEDCFVDPKALTTAKNLFNLNPNQIAPYYQIEHCGEVTFVLSMFHSRAILAPVYASQYFPNYFSCIIHVDDHADLMGTVLCSTDTPGKLYDTFFHQVIDICDPVSVITAIDSGIINKGNFLTSYLLAYSPGDVFFVHPGTGANGDEYLLFPEEIIHDFSGRKITTTSVIISKEDSVNFWRWHRVAYLPQHIPIQPHPSVWLDIDLDAFCNRFDGDSDRGNLTLTEAEQHIVRERIESLLLSLSTASWVKHVRAVSIAISPNFFPADYWADTIARLYRDVKTLICQTQIYQS